MLAQIYPVKLQLYPAKFLLIYNLTDHSQFGKNTNNSIVTSYKTHITMADYTPEEEWSKVLSSLHLFGEVLNTHGVEIIDEH